MLLLCLRSGAPSSQTEGNSARTLPLICLPWPHRGARNSFKSPLTSESQLELVSGWAESREQRSYLSTLSKRTDPHSYYPGKFTLGRIQLGVWAESYDQQLACLWC